MCEYMTIPTQAHTGFLLFEIYVGGVSVKPHAHRLKLPGEDLPVSPRLGGIEHLGGRGDHE